MVEKIKIKNWVEGNSIETLSQIHNFEANIAIYNRDITTVEQEINTVLNQSIAFRASGSIDLIIQKIQNELQQCTLLLDDIKKLLLSFQEITKAKSYKLMLASVNTNMCRKFHTDINDLRMLCTYSGPGTLWLSEDNINRQALNSHDDNENIVIDESKVQQVKTGAVVILKGAIYPKEETRAVVHRSPTIEESNEKRLFLRIDTNEFLNF